MDRRSFEAEVTQQGYDTRDTGVTPNERRDMHTHEFDAKLLILDGTFILATPGGEQSFSTGAICTRSGRNDACRIRRPRGRALHRRPQVPHRSQPGRLTRRASDQRKNQVECLQRLGVNA